MSTGKRLAKRSIIGTRVCAPGDDGKYYSGFISAVNTPASPQQPELAGLSITPHTRYTVRFDSVPPGCKAPDSKNEYSDRDLIGPGFGSVTSAKLVAGQKVYLTYNGREIHAVVTEHRQHLDEVDVLIAPSGQEGTMSLTKRIDEVRLLESRKSARLADSDTDFARLADMGSDRKRATSNSIDVPHVIGSRKRRPSSCNDTYSSSWPERTNDSSQRGIYMDECSAAMVLMSLATPPKDPLPLHCLQHFGTWEDRVNSSGNRPMVGTPATSVSTSSSPSWRTGTPSPPLLDDDITMPMWPENGTANATTMANPAHNQKYSAYKFNSARGSSSSSPNFTYDEGIVPDFDQERPRKKKIRCRVEYDDCISISPNTSSNSDNEMVKPITIYKCTWRDEDNRNLRCGEVGHTWDAVAEHVLRTHLRGKKTDDNEADFYVVDELYEPACSPPTKSHWDMVRPRSEDPEYQKQVRLAASPAQNSPQIAAAVNTQDIIIHDVFTMATPQSLNNNGKQFKPPPMPLQNPFDATNISLVTVSLGKMSHATRRLRGDTKKCRKIYGMDNRDLWCTQCKWKKACTRFGK